jgi:nitrate reductase NapE component
VARALHKDTATNQIFMKTTESINEVQESTYALLVRSEEKERSLFETIAYGLFILSAVAAIGQFALQPVSLPLETMPQTASVKQAQVVSHS